MQKPEDGLNDLMAGVHRTNDAFTQMMGDAFVDCLLAQGYMEAFRLADLKLQRSKERLTEHLNGITRVSFADRVSGHLDRGEDKYPDDMQLPRMMNRAVG